MKTDSLNITLKGTRNYQVLTADNVLDLTHAQSLEQKINRVISFLNEDYYSFGKILQENYLISKKVIAGLRDITSLISSEDLKSGLDHLKETIRDLENIFNGFEEGSASKNLFSIRDNLLLVIYSLDDYNKIVKHLRALGISTKIENARLSADGTGFGTIAENVEQLAEVINEKALQLRNKSDSLSSDVQTLVTKLNVLREEEKNDLVLVIGEANQSMSEYQLSCSASFNNAGLIQGLSSKISADINNLITFIQKQDIIRQQLEHVKENISLLSRQSSKNQLSLDNDSAAVKQFIAACQLELAQVLNSKKEIEETAESIEAYNKNISLNAHGIVEQSDSFLFSGDAASSLEKVGKNLTVISEALKKCNHINEVAAGSINSLAGAIADLNRFVSEIEEIGSEIELIALNARVKAAHIGNDGAALGVLSEAIQKLSLEAKQLSAMVSEGLLKVLNKAEDLSRRNKEEQLTILKDFNTAEGSLQGSLMKIRNSNLELDAMKTELNNSFKEMKQKLEEMKSGLRYKDEVLEEIIYVQMILEEYMEFANDAGLVISEEDKAFLKGLSSSYTMDSERRVHTLLMSEKEINSPAGEDDLLGDNVELF
ncbi:MAG: hypothetical protein ACM34K_11220 [Bacillota bacterium]